MVTHAGAPGKAPIKEGANEFAPSADDAEKPNCAADHPVAIPRRQGLRRMIGGAFAFWLMGQGGRSTAEPAHEENDLRINDTTALLYSQEAPLVPAKGLRDARAVWCRVTPGARSSALVFLHGHNNYVTVDSSGKSRVPDWALENDSARAGAQSKPAAPLIYGLDCLEKQPAGKKPIVLVPEVSTLGSKSFWAREPAGQYADPTQLGRLIQDCLRRLERLHLLDEKTRPSVDLEKPNSAEAKTTASGRPPLARIYLSGHSGAGLPLEEAARSHILQPDQGVPTDLWLFDCTYWSNVAGFVHFCEQWHRSGRLAGGQADATRFICAYRAGTDTEGVADSLRGQIAKILRVAPESLLQEHTPQNLEKDVRPSLEKRGVVFLRTHLDHNEIPKQLIPILLQTAAS